MHEKTISRLKSAKGERGGAQSRDLENYEPLKDLMLQKDLLAGGRKEAGGRA